MSELDRDYDEYRREHQSRFEHDFGSWRERRQQKRGCPCDRWLTHRRGSLQLVRLYSFCPWARVATARSHAALSPLNGAFW